MNSKRRPIWASRAAPPGQSVIPAKTQKITGHVID